MTTMETVTESTELTALRQKLVEIEARIDVKRRLVESTMTCMGDLAAHRSDCLKQVAKLAANALCEGSAD